MGALLLEHIDGPALAPREGRVVDVQIGLVIDAERAVVEIGRADRDPQPIHHHHLEWNMVGWYS
ncbi:MAG: hypothetical protein H0W40_07670 [Methylibium sp.]|nr:hypothetical protein [Methylibium sp.]